MHGNEPFLTVFPYFALMLMCVYGLTSMLGLSVLLARPNGLRMWAYGVVGFVAGALLGGFLGAIDFLHSGAMPFLEYAPFLLPPGGGAIALMFAIRNKKSG